MSEPLYANLWQSAGTGWQWTDGWPHESHTREVCNRAADTIHKTTSIRRIALLRIYPKQERQP